METKLNKESRAAIELMVANGIITKDTAERFFHECIRNFLISKMKEVGNVWKEYSAKDIISWLEKQGKLVEYYEDKLDRCACENFNKGYKKALEKQGEHAKFCDSIQVGDKVTRNQDGVLVNLTQLNRVAKKEEPTYTQKDIADAYLKGLEDAKSTEIKTDPCIGCDQRAMNCHNFPCEAKKAFEQKLIEGSYTSIVEIGNGGITSVVERDLSTEGCYSEQKPTDKVEPKFEVDSNEDGLIADTIRYKNEQKPAWSEEDERMCQDTINWFEKKVFPYALEHENPARKNISWLKSLKDRVQPKQEWSEEDSVRLQRIIDFLWYNRKGDTDTIYQQEQDIDWLKSLRPQNKQVYNPYKAVVESIAAMVEKYAPFDSNLQDFYNNIKVKCKDAKEYDSLYPQNTWKPSNEQLIELKMAAGGGFFRGKTLIELYEQLKKL